jgi:hypothetical protein
VLLNTGPSSVPRTSPPVFYGKKQIAALDWRISPVMLGALELEPCFTDINVTFYYMLADAMAVAICKMPGVR